MENKTEVVSGGSNMAQTAMIINAPDLQPSPAQMLQTAVTNGLDIDKLSKLIELQERWESNEAKKAYNRSMAEFKANPPKIDKDRHDRKHYGQQMPTRHFGTLDI